MAPKIGRIASAGRRSPATGQANSAPTRLPESTRAGAGQVWARRCAIVLVLLVFARSPANASRVYGWLTSEGAAVSGVTVEIARGRESSSASTDKSGYYTLDVNGGAVYTVTVYYAGQKPSLPVRVSAPSIHSDLVLKWDPVKHQY